MKFGESIDVDDKHSWKSMSDIFDNQYESDGHAVRKFYEDLIHSNIDKPMGDSCAASSSIEPVESRASTSSQNCLIKRSESKPLRNKSDINQESSAINLDTFLKFASDGNLNEFIKCCESGIDINQCDQFGWTALMCAAFSGHFAIVEYLISNGAEIHLRDKAGLSALDYASKNNHHDVFLLLIGNKKKPRRRSNAPKKDNSKKYCKACDRDYSDEWHQTSLVHLMQTTKPSRDPGYGIPKWNKGYRILMKSGWNEYSGLGKNSCGMRYPVRTVLKRDRSGLGSNVGEAKVTHFQVCEACCGSLMEQFFESAKLVCPFDRIETHITELSTSSLMKNYALIEAIERHSKQPIKSETREQWDQHHRETGEVVSEYLKDALLGIVCDEDPSHTAVLYCTTCKSNLCMRCSERTHTGRVLTRHQRVRLSQKPPAKTMCQYHSAYAVEFVCQEIDCLDGNRLMCLLCRDYGRHQRHRHSLLEIEAAELRERVKEALTDFRNFISDLNGWNARVTQAVNEIMSSVDGSYAQAKHQVESHFRRLQDELEAQKQAALLRLETHVTERVDALRQHQNELAYITSHVSAITLQLQDSAEMHDVKLIEQQTDLIKMLDTVKMHQYDVASVPSNVSLNARIPFTFLSNNTIHMGSNVDIRMVILGLDGAGKTTILYKLKNDECRQLSTTVGFNVETIQYQNFKLTIWDVGGLPKLRPLWRHYFANTQALLFVIDSSCSSRFTEAQHELLRIFGERELHDACFLVILNRKQNSRNNNFCEIDSAAIDQLVMNINRFGAGRSVLIHQCNAITGIGLWEAIDSLTSNLLLTRNQNKVDEEQIISCNRN